MSKESTLKESLTDWKRLDALQDEDIDLSDAPEITPEMFAKAVVRRGLKPPASKQQITIRLDDDVLKWFRAQGDGYQTRHQLVVARVHGGASRMIGGGSRRFLFSIESGFPARQKTIHLVCGLSCGESSARFASLGSLPCRVRVA